MVSSPTTASDEAERAELATKAMLAQNSLALEAQLEERPLAKKQEALQGGDAAAHDAEQTAPSATSTKGGEEPHPKREKLKPLLKNDDTELERVAKVRTFSGDGLGLYLMFYLFSCWKKCTNAFLMRIVIVLPST